VRPQHRHTSLASFHDVSDLELATAWDIVLIPVSRMSSEFGNPGSPLMHVHWQRIILDEGHQLGATSTITAKLSMACALRAGRTGLQNDGGDGAYRMTGVTGVTGPTGV
jgi:hypothetical protein